MRLVRLGPRAVRILIQALFLAAFAAVMVGLGVSVVPGAAASFLLALDPLTAIGTGLADWTLPAWTWLGVLVLVATLFLGRFFCGWMCPLGTLQQLVSWLAGPSRRRRRALNRYRSWFAVKYVILIVLLVLAACGANHLGWLDPLPLLHRAVAGGLRPLWHGSLAPGGWVAFGLLLAILLASAWMPRFFCRALCPLGAALGVAARLAPLRIRRDGDACTSCTLCAMACQGADEPLGEHRVAECHVCLNCLDSCAEASLRWGSPSTAEAPRTMPLDVGRRRALLAAAGAAVAAPVLAVGGGGRAARAADAIRPPGALGEPAFLARCITCGACAASCPTGVIASDLGRTGIEGLFTPVMLMRRGWCEPSCTRCGEVCPTGALVRLVPAAKQAIGAPAEVTVGTAFVDRGRCLPWAMDTPCIVCEEMCPTSPKAIHLEEVLVTDPRGRQLRLQRPWVDPAMCTGCGLCENRCPVGQRAAIRVSSVGESRDPDNQLLVGTRQEA